jgi:hypothetical protein
MYMLNMGLSIDFGEMCGLIDRTLLNHRNDSVNGGDRMGGFNPFQWCRQPKFHLFWIDEQSPVRLS